DEQQLDSSSPLPLHHQLSEVLKNQIVNGYILDKDLKLPTETELETKYKVSRITVRKAIQTLVDNGLVYRERGRGTFLRTKNTEVWYGKLMGFSEHMETKGIKTDS